MNQSFADSTFRKRLSASRDNPPEPLGAPTGDLPAASPAPTQPAAPATPAAPTAASPLPSAHIFISYKSSDRPLVSALALRLAEHGHAVWYDQQLVGGQSWWDEILHNIRDADVFLFALTPAALQSQPCQLEYTYAHALRKRVLPVRLSDGVDPRLLPAALQQIQVVDCRTPDQGGWDRLATALATLPTAVALPMDLPDAPAAPISPLGKLKEQMDARSLSPEAQAYIFVELKTLLKDREAADGARQLLRQFRYHPDLRAAIADEITPLIGD